VNYYFHDKHLRSNPAAKGGRQVMATDLYGMQDNIHNKNQLENLAFLEQLRALCDQYDDIMMVGEVGDMGQRSIDLMAEYTKGSSRLHMAYSFAMLGPDFNPKHFRGCIEGFQKGAPDGQPEWSFSNHDVPRHVTRWAEHAVSDESIAKLACAMLMSFEGTIGIYQGEELGQLETVMKFEELTDLQAIRYWPGVKGRDGCRTPMVWDHKADNAGFTAGTPWLPVKAPQVAHSVDLQEAQNDSVLHFYRQTIGFRKSHPCMTRGKTAWIDLPDPMLAFTRSTADQHLTCVFNLSKAPQTLTVTGTATLTGPQHATLADSTLTLPGNGFAFLGHSATLKLTA
jgi:alpha-glucosidase